MFRLENQSSQSPNPNQSPDKKGHRKTYAAIAALAVIIVVAGAFLALQSEGSAMELSLNYNVGEHMVYKTTNIVTNKLSNITVQVPGEATSQAYNSTLTMDVIGINGADYQVNEIIKVDTNLLGNLPTLTVNISKTSYYNNFIAPGAPLIFYNATNPTILAYLAQPTVKAGDVWTIPVNTGNASLGLTGEVTLKFVGFEDITVPAGTYHVMRVEVTSSNLIVHSDNTSLIQGLNGTTLQLNGTSYVEQSTCRLIKADLTQTTVISASGIDRSSILYTEKTLTEHTKP